MMMMPNGQLQQVVLAPQQFQMQQLAAESQQTMQLASMAALPAAANLTSTVASSKTPAYASTETVSASSSSLGLSSATNSRKMSVNTTQGNKLVPGMPPGVAGVLPAQYMTPAGKIIV